jgi:hypothetical protein
MCFLLFLRQRPRTKRLLRYRAGMMEICPQLLLTKRCVCDAAHGDGHAAVGVRMWSYRPDGADQQAQAERAARRTPRCPYPPSWPMRRAISRHTSSTSVTAACQPAVTRRGRSRILSLSADNCTTYNLVMTTCHVHARTRKAGAEA